MSRVPWARIRDILAEVSEHEFREEVLGKLDRILAILTHHALGSVNLMAVPTGPVDVGQSFQVIATAALADGTEASQATLTVSSSDETVLTATFLSSGVEGPTLGSGTVECNALAAGSATVTVTATNPDGSVVAAGTDNPFTVTVVAVDAVAVNVA